MGIEDHPINVLHRAGAPDMVTHDAKQLLNKAIASFEQATGRTLSPSEVEMYLLETMAYLLSVHGSEKQQAFENCYVAYAQPDYLDLHGADRNTPRLEASPAETTIRFATDTPATSLIQIPEGTRVSDAAGQVQFATKSVQFLAVGDSYVDVQAEAVQVGIVGNGFAVGALNALVDPVVGIDSVSNLTATGAGADRETDVRYRARLPLAFERLGDGLSRERYHGDVFGWSARCIDVRCERPQDGHVNIYPLMDTGAPNAAELASCAAVFNKSNTHQGDYIQVFAPTEHAFSVTLKLFLADPDAEAPARAAVQHVLDKWRRSLGGHVAPSALTHAAKNVDGVVEADVPGLAFTEVAYSAFRAGTITSVDVELV